MSKINQFLHCELLPKWARWRYVAYSGFPLLSWSNLFGLGDWIMALCCPCFFSFCMFMDLDCISNLDRISTPSLARDCSMTNLLGMQRKPFFDLENLRCITLRVILTEPTPIMYQNVLCNVHSNLINTCQPSCFYCRVPLILHQFSNAQNLDLNLCLWPLG